MSESFEGASAAGERLMAELRSDPDISKQRTFEEVFLKQLGLYCASVEKGAGAFQVPLQPNLMKFFEQMAILSIRNLMISATMESIAGHRESQDVVFGSISYAIEGISVSDVVVDADLTSLQIFQGRVSLRTSGLSICFNGVHFMYRQSEFPFLRDQGSANVLLSNVSISMDWASAATSADSVEPHSADITSVAVKIGDFDMKISGQSPDFLYRIVASFLDLRSAFELGLHNMISSQMPSFTSLFLPQIDLMRFGAFCERQP
jgi:hypothetical protein